MIESALFRTKSSILVMPLQQPFLKCWLPKKKKLKKKNAEIAVFDTCKPKMVWQSKKKKWLKSNGWKNKSRILPLVWWLNPAAEMSLFYSSLQKRSSWLNNNNQVYKKWLFRCPPAMDQALFCECKSINFWLWWTV